MPYSSVRGGFVCKKELGTCPKLDAIRGTVGLQKGEARTNTLSFSVQLQDCHPKARGMHNSIIFLPLKAHIIIKCALILAGSWVCPASAFAQQPAFLLHFSRIVLYFLKQVKRLCAHLYEREWGRARAQKQHDHKAVGRGSRAVGLHLLPMHCSATLSRTVQVHLCPRKGCGGGNVPAGEQRWGQWWGRTQWWGRMQQWHSERIQGVQKENTLHLGICSKALLTAQNWSSAILPTPSSKK